MSWEANYYKQKEELLNDSSICKHNRDLFKLFFEKREKKLIASIYLSNLCCSGVSAIIFNLSQNSV
jgi:hypothetical protein